MPQLTDSRKVISVKLQTIEGGEILIFNSFLAGQIEEVQARKDKNDFSILEPIVMLIQSWNLTNDKDESLPVNLENVRRLDMKDILAIQKEIDLESFLDKDTIAKLKK